MKAPQSMPANSFRGQGSNTWCQGMQHVQSTGKEPLPEHCRHHCTAATMRHPPPPATTSSAAPIRTQNAVEFDKRNEAPDSIHCTLKKQAAVTGLQREMVFHNTGQDKGGKYSTQAAQHHTACLETACLVGTLHEIIHTNAPKHPRYPCDHQSLCCGCLIRRAEPLLVQCASPEP